MVNNYQSLIPTVNDQNVDLLSFGDIDKMRNKIFRKVKDAFSKLEPHEYGSYVLKIENVDYESIPDYTIKDHLNAIFHSKNLDVRLKGDVVIYDKRNNSEVMRRRMTLMHVPYLSRHGTFIFSGNSYSISNQMRLRPGVYTRVKDNGIVEALINTPGGGTHHYELDPETGIFYVKYGTKTIPLLSVTRALGIPDETLANLWGQKIFSANAAIAKPVDITRFMREHDYERAKEKLRNWITSLQLDPVITNYTLGKPYRNITDEVIIKTTKKMIDVYRGIQQPDERDSLFAQQIVGPDDLIAEKVNYAHLQMKKYIPRAIRKGSLDVIPSAPYDYGLQALVFGSGLAELLEETNPTEVLERFSRVVKTGEGGIEDPQRIKDDPRMVHPTQLGFVDPAITGALAKAGVDNRFSWLVHRGDDGKVYALFRDVKNNKYVWRSPADLAEAVITFPGELEKQTEFVRVIHRGEHKFVPRYMVDYELPFHPQMFSVVTNLIPAVVTIFPQRLMIAEKTHLQALPIVNPEEPLVQTKFPFADTSFQRYLRRFYYPIISDVNGKVTKVTNDEIEVLTETGKKRKFELYNYYPLNRRTFLHNTPLVKEGDAVRTGQVLAKSNFTDNNGYPAFGLNAYVAYIPFKGYSYEDAVVISESFAKRLTSQHLFQEQLDLGPGVHLGKQRFQAQFPGKYPVKLYDAYDDDGVIRPGTKVVPGQPLVLAVGESFNIAGKRKIFRDISLTWDQSVPGEVIHAIKTDKYVYITVKAEFPTVVGDKIVGRMGDKGVVGYVVPDDKMPRDSEGRPFDVLFNQLGIPTRTNLAQVFEAVLGKIAKKLGTPYFVPYNVNNYWEFVNDEAQKYGIATDDYVYDPETGRKIGPVLTGYRYFMKLHHTAESKLQEREFSEYTSEDLPARGGKEGAKKIGILELMGIIGHSAYKVIRDAKLIRGQKNEQFWFEFMNGGFPPIDKYPLVYDKFINQLIAAGINVQHTGTSINVFALTNDDIKKLTGHRELQNSETIAIKNDQLIEKPGGLFDVTLTGGLDGNFWSYFKLAEPMPSPVMENVLATFLNVTREQFRNILYGLATIPGTNLSGPFGLITYFRNSFNPEAELKKAEAELETALDNKKLNDVNKLTRKIRYLRATIENNQHPVQWFWDRVPVLPPKFRPISSTEKVLLVADVNHLYQTLMEANNLLKEQMQFTDDLADARRAVYESLLAVTGIGEPIQFKQRQQGLQGLLKQIASDKAKFNFVIRKLLSITSDLTGRAVIAPNPGLKIDEIGIPIEQIWKLYRPFIIRRLVMKGYNFMDALNAYLKQDDAAKRELLIEIRERPVIVNRAPVLHRYGVMAFWPVLTRNKVIEANPFICATFGADFDGDAVQVHVPVSKEAVQEAIDKMLPSKNLISSASFFVNYPISNEFLAGLWVATTKRKSEPPKRFRTKADVINAFKRGLVDIDTPVIVESA